MINCNTCIVGITFLIASIYSIIHGHKKDIFIKELGRYDEIILIGSGKGVVSVNRIEKTDWKRKNLKNYRFLSKIYAKALRNCPRYNG